jgi:hypothetical protein
VLERGVRTPPLTAVEREAIRRAHLACEENARGVGMSRRQFLFTASAAATTLLTLQGCLGDSGNSSWGRYTVPAEAGKDQDAARSALAGEEFIFDVQGHHLEYDLMPGPERRPGLRDRAEDEEVRVHAPRPGEDPGPDRRQARHLRAAERRRGRAGPRAPPGVAGVRLPR